MLIKDGPPEDSNLGVEILSVFHLVYGNISSDY